MPDQDPTAASDLRQTLTARFRALLERCFRDEAAGAAAEDASPAPRVDRALAESLARLLFDLGELPREHLIGLQLHGIPGARERQRVRQTGEELVTFRRVADASGFGFVVADLRGIVSYANPAFTTLVGMEEGEQPIGHSLFDFYAPELRPAFTERILPTVLKEGQWSGELPLRRRSREETPTLQSLFVVRGEAGAPPYLASLVLDISARTRAEDALRRSEERFRGIFEHSTIGIYQTTPDGRILLANPALVRMLGYSSESELQQLDLEESGYAPQYPRRDFKRRIERAGRVTGQEAVWLRRDGTPIHVRESARVVRDDRGRTLYYEGTVEDVSEIHRAAEAMRTSEENFRALAENANEGILIAVGDGAHVYANPRAAEITGYAVSDLIGMTYWDLAHPGESQMIDQRYRGRMAGRPVPRQYETRIVARDGRHIPIELTGSRTTWYGKPADIVFFRDITNRKLSEQALRESEEKYRTLVEQIDEALYEFDAHGIVTYVSPSIERITGYTAGELIGRTFVDLVPPQDVEEARERLVAVREGRAPRQAEIRLQTKDGEQRWIRHHSRPIEIGGQVVGMRGVVMDITDLKSAEEALRASEEKFRTIVEEIGEVIYEFGPDGRIRFISPAVRAYGYEPDELIGRTVLDLVLPEDRPEMERRFQGILEGQAPRQAEARIVTKSGEARWIHHSSAYIEREGRTTGMRGVVVDIHDRKTAEEALRRSEERYRRLVEELDAIIYEHDAEGRLTFVSPAIQRILGYRPAEIEGRSVLEFVKPEREPHVREMLAGLATGSGEGIGEFEVRTKAGALRWLRHVARPMMIEGHYAGARGIVYDITDLRETAQALSETEIQYASMLEHLTDGVLIIQDERIRFVNPAVEQVTGYSTEEMLGMHFLEIVAPEQRAAAAARHQRRMAGEDEPTFYDLRIVSKEGVETEFEIAVSMIPFRTRPAVLVVARQTAQRMEREDGAP
ncbi:MAG: PAS domain S-box protein [Candidatus Eisenbacteria bacterium]|nr:PAS domain S-box protein [Candidatus Eisenbacteria bacterium]